MMLRHAILPAALAALVAASSPALAQAPAKSKGGAGSKAQDEAKALADEKALLELTRKVQTTYLRGLEKVVSAAASKGLKDEAKTVLAKMERIDPAYAALPKLKKQVDAAKSPADPKALDEARKALAKQIVSVDEGQAKRLFDLAKRCMQLGRFTRAYELVKDVLDADPDHKQARTILGWTWDATSKSWITQWEAQQRKTHFLTDEGWVPKKDKARWDKGLRDYKGKWIAKEEEERIRKRNNYEHFSVETEHFLVQSNLGRKQAFEFAKKLEDFYGAFFEFFIGFHDQKKSAELLFNQAKARKKHQVMIFPSRVEYLDFVRAEKGNNELAVRSAGFWADSDRRSFFYWTENPDEALNTLYHETTHQLLGETKESRGQSDGNVWIVEGIAVYMETWQKVAGKWQPGYRIDAPELLMVQKFLEANPTWDLQSYLSLGHKEFHDPKGRGLHYALGGALSHFLMHYEDGLYRDDFIELLKAYYEGKVQPDSFARALRVEGADAPAAKLAIIDKQFRNYMKDLRRPGVAAPADGEPEPSSAAAGDGG